MPIDLLTFNDANAALVDPVGDVNLITLRRGTTNNTPLTHDDMDDNTSNISNRLNDAIGQLNDFFGSTSSSTDGKLGIKVANPASELDVLGQIYSHVSATYAPLYVNQAGSGAAAYFTGGNVGIGTTNPARLLHLVGDNAYIWMDDAGGGRSFYLGSDGSNNAVLKMYDGSHAAIAQIHSDGVSYFNGGNVGIGIDAPSEMLHLREDAPELWLESSNASGNTYALKSTSTGYLWIGKPTSSSGLSVGEVDITISPTGNVGIGIDTPGLNSDQSTTISGTVLDVAGAADAVIRILADKDNSAGEPGSAKLYLHTDGGGNGAYLESPNALGDPQLTLGISSNNASGAMSAGDNPVITIDESLNVGIGTGITAASARLDVKHSNANGTRWWTNPDATQILYNSNSTVGSSPILRFQTYGTGHPSRIVYGCDAADDKLIFTSREAEGTAGKEIVFDADGNVGIGTDSPDYRLQVGESSSIYPNEIAAAFIGSTTSTNDKIGIQFGSDAQSCASRIYAAVESTNNSFLTFETKSSGAMAEKVRITSDGKVGIGTTTPTADLEVTHDAKTIALSGGGTDSRIGFMSDKVGTTKWEIRNNQDAKLQINEGSNTNPRLTILNGGKVGIGTASPFSNLDTAGTIRAISGTHQPPTSGTGTEMFHNGTRGYVFAFDRTASAYGDIQLGTSLHVKGAGTYNGRVGIGTTTPSCRLVIAGTDAIALPVGTDNQRPTAVAGMLRFNSTGTEFEGYDGSAWGAIGGAGVTNLSYGRPTVNPTALTLSSSTEDNGGIALPNATQTGVGGGGWGLMTDVDKTKLDILIASRVAVTHSSLSSTITSSVTTIPITSATDFPTSGTVVVGYPNVFPPTLEEITYTGKSGNSLTGATRGANGTTAVAHGSGEAIGSTVLNMDDITTITSGQASAITTNSTHSGSTHAPSGAEANVQSDWNQTTSGHDAYIANKPTTITAGQTSAISVNAAKVSFPGIGITSSTCLAGDTVTVDTWVGGASLLTTAISSNTTHRTSAHAPSGAEANVQSDWAQTTSSHDAYIDNKPTVLALGTTSANALAGDNYFAIQSNTTAIAAKVTTGGSAQAVTIDFTYSSGVLTITTT